MPKFDEISQRILLELQQDARQSNRELARRIGVADSTCLERVRALRANGVITGYRAELDLNAIDRGLLAMIAVRIQPKSRDAVDAFRNFAADLPEVLDIFVVAGTDDFQLLVAVNEARHLEDFVLDRIAQFPAVSDLRTSLVYDHITRRPVEFLRPEEREPTPVPRLRSGSATARVTSG